MEIITKDFSAALRGMKVNEVLAFPLENEASITCSLIPRLRRQMWKEKADWKRVGEYDMEHGTFQVKRVLR